MAAAVVSSVPVAPAGLLRAAPDSQVALAGSVEDLSASISLASWAEALAAQVWFLQPEDDLAERDLVCPPLEALLTVSVRA